MSAWLCGNKTLSLCIDVIKSDEFKFYDDGTYSEKSNEELLELLSELNTRSLDCRYGVYDGHILKNKEYISLDVSDAQKHKSVCCYLYQTCECPENEEHPLFQNLEQWSDDRRGEYEPLWNDLKWDMDSIY